MKIRIKKVPQHYSENALNARHWKHGLGGNLFEEGGKPNIFMRPDGTYFYQASPGSEEVTVTPQTTIFDNPALWTYVDKEGKRYTPKETPIPEQGTITEHVSHGPIVDAVNNYYREGIYRANNGTLALRGKYMLPLAGIAATGIGTAIEAPFATAMSIAEGTVGGLATDMLSYGLSGNRWATNMSNWTGLDKPIAELTNPGLLFGGQAGYSGGRTIARGVAQDRILASEHTPKMAELYSKIYKGDISELQNQTPWRALTKGSPNLGNEYGIFDKNNPLWNPRRDKTAFISELANYTLPFAGPIKTAARWPLANYMSESASPERMLDDVFSLRDVGTMLKPFIKRGKYNGLVDSELGFPTDVEKEYPGINFLNYYLWKNDPLLKLTPSVKTTASYFRENPAPFKTSFGERYNLYGDVSQGRMPVKSAETLDKEIAKELASKHPIPQIRTKDLDGITKEGIENSDKLYRLTHDEAPLEVNKWIGIEEPFNPDLPELNIAGHQMFLDSNNGTLLSRDIWKFNPWDWRVKWGEHGGSAAQAGILDKLGTPFITTSKNNLNKDALLYLKSK